MGTSLSNNSWNFYDINHPLACFSFPALFPAPLPGSVDATCAKNFVLSFTSLIPIPLTFSLLKSLNHKVFWPPFVLLLSCTLASLLFEARFLQSVQLVNAWMLSHFDWLFSWATFSFLLVLVAVYVSPLGRVTIGGKAAQPILSKWRWFSITLCTTIATGILFWGTAEPIFHLTAPPEGLDIAPNSRQAATFAMSTMYMHWTLTPYGIYTMVGLLFALTYYNLRQPFNLGSLLYPLMGRRSQGWLGDLTDIICLFALVAGMAASLGAGILTISGGLNTIWGLEQNVWLNLLIGMAIIASFIISASTGMLKGIKVLSDYNIKAFIGLAIFVFVMGPTSEMLDIGWRGLVDYVQHFFPRSTNLGSRLDTEWRHGWTIFYWANWLAWAPITALFLGRIARGYSVRDFIHFNLLLPSLFGALWMITFSGASIYYDTQSETALLSDTLNAQGPQNVVFELIRLMPWGSTVSVIFLLIAFLSYVTAADSNTLAMSGISARDITPDNPEAPRGIKVLWGVIIGLLAFVMISYAGIDGIKLISTLGGFPVLFLALAVCASLGVLIWKRDALLVEETADEGGSDAGATEGEAAN